MIIGFDKNKSVNENNEKILTEISKLNFSLMDEDDLIILADSLFKLFKGNFESSNYPEMNEISHYCKIVVDSCIDRKLYNKKHYGETIIDNAIQINILCDTSENYTYATAMESVRQIETSYSKMEDVEILESTSDKTISEKKFASLLMKVEEDGSVVYVNVYTTDHDGFAYLIIVTYHELGYSENARTMVKDFMNSIKFK